MGQHLESFEVKPKSSVDSPLSETELFHLGVLYPQMKQFVEWGEQNAIHNVETEKPANAKVLQHFIDLAQAHIPNELTLNLMRVRNTGNKKHFLFTYKQSLYLMSLYDHILFLFF